MSRWSADYDSLINRGEYFSSYYLTQIAHRDLSGVFGAWDEAEGIGKVTPREGLHALGGDYFDARPDVASADPDDLETWRDGEPGTALRSLHDVILEALGYPSERMTAELTWGGEQPVHVPVAHLSQTETGPHLIVLEAPFATEVDQLLGDPRWQLIRPVTRAGEEEPDVARAIATTFATDDPPRYVLVLAGGVIVLADREKWTEGRYLACHLEPALERGDTTKKGELSVLAALFSADATLPSGGRSELDELVTKSIRNAEGVSKDLRDGIRASIELLANEVIDRRREANLRVYDEPDVARKLTRQSLRYLYRLVVLLFAEARPELGIVPVDAPEYREGYGLDRLRDLTILDLQTPDALNGTHLHESLELLFRLVREGHRPTRDAEQRTIPADSPHLGSEGIGLRFDRLDASLFAADATPLFKNIKLRNRVLQQVLANLMVTRQRSGKDRSFLSYANLGVNQLGAVYEELMAYHGFLADEDLYEVCQPGKQDRGTWVVPVADADTYPDEVFVTESDEHGRQQRVRHDKGAFVFRLSGRDRERTASYYTPEVLTNHVVDHALRELLDDETPAAELLDLTICEPALGSGAFLNAAINQIAAAYLKRAQEQRSEQLPPDEYIAALQRVKTYIARDQSYGVDLNHSAVELAEVSLWLNVMHRDLAVPSFAWHLRRGNSLIGCRRATFSVNDDLESGAWLSEPPADRPLCGQHADRLPESEIHHFLLPASGWGAVADSPTARDLAPSALGEIKSWRNRITKTPGRASRQRLLALSERVEMLWSQAIDELRRAERQTRDRRGLYGIDSAAAEPRDRAPVHEDLRRPTGPLARLRAVMDTWCALWAWPVTAEESPPGLNDWLDGCQRLLDDGDPGQVSESSPWLSICREIADREGYFHWELEFGHVFANGGFDLQIGNPPWVRPIWQDELVLAELDPWFGVTKQQAQDEFEQRRERVLADGQQKKAYLTDLSQHAGVTELLSDKQLRPVLSGIQTNLYMNFIDETTRHVSPAGAVGLLHPNGHFADPKAGQLRQHVYRRLRRHWHYRNEERLFEDVGHTREYSVNVYTTPTAPSFWMLNDAKLPETVDRSIDHDGTGPVPGVKTPAGDWDHRPHLDRLVRVEMGVLEAFRNLVDDPDTPVEQARLLRPFSSVETEVATLLTRQEVRLGDLDPHWSSGLHEKGAKRDGTIRWDTHVPDSWDEVVLQGPHFDICNPLAQQPNEDCKNAQDYTALNLTDLSPGFVPRTNYRIAVSIDELLARIDRWGERPSNEYWRLILRRRIDSGMERSLMPALLLPGPVHVDGCQSLGFEQLSNTLVLIGLWSGIVFDFSLRVTGRSDFRYDAASQMPAPIGGGARDLIVHRAARLNCLAPSWAPGWNQVVQPTWSNDKWTRDDSRLEPFNVTGSWDESVPLRTPFERRQALVELDALGAISLGLSPDQLCAIYRSNFGVLRKHENRMWFDAEGRMVNDGRAQSNELGAAPLKGPSGRLGGSAV